MAGSSSDTYGPEVEAYRPIYRHGARVDGAPAHCAGVGLSDAHGALVTEIDGQALLGVQIHAIGL